jgi:hypothetical protein
MEMQIEAAVVDATQADDNSPKSVWRRTCANPVMLRTAALPFVFGSSRYDARIGMLQVMQPRVKSFRR